jgi:hypothetical protein
MGSHDCLRAIYFTHEVNRHTWTFSDPTGCHRIFVSAVPDRKENGLSRHRRRACFYSGDQSHLGLRARIRQLARTPRTRIAPS